MTKQQLEAYVWMLGYGSVELIRDVHAGQRHDERTFFVYLAMASKDAHVSCRIHVPAQTLAATLPAGTLQLDHEGRRNRSRRFYASGQAIQYGLPCLMCAHLARADSHPWYRQPRPHIDRALVLR